MTADEHVGSLDAWLRPSSKPSWTPTFRSANDSAYALKAQLERSSTSTEPIPIPRRPPQKGQPAPSRNYILLEALDAELHDAAVLHNEHLSVPHLHIPAADTSGRAEALPQADPPQADPPQADPHCTAHFDAGPTARPVRSKQGTASQQARQGALAELFAAAVGNKINATSPCGPACSLPVQETQAPVSLAALCTALSSPAAQEPSLANPGTRGAGGHSQAPSAVADACTVMAMGAFERSMAGPAGRGGHGLRAILGGAAGPVGGATAAVLPTEIHYIDSWRAAAALEGGSVVGIVATPLLARPVPPKRGGAQATGRGGSIRNTWLCGAATSWGAESQGSSWADGAEGWPVRV